MQQNTDNKHLILKLNSRLLLTLKAHASKNVVHYVTKSFYSHWNDHSMRFLWSKWSIHCLAHRFAMRKTNIILTYIVQPHFRLSHESYVLLLKNFKSKVNLKFTHVFQKKCLYQSFPVLPFLFIVINTDSSWTKGNNQQQAANHRGCLEEVVLEEISQWWLRMVHPPWIHIDVKSGQQKN